MEPAAALPGPPAPEEEQTGSKHGASAVACDSFEATPQTNTTRTRGRPKETCIGLGVDHSLRCPPCCNKKLKLPCLRKKGYNAYDC